MKENLEKYEKDIEKHNTKYNWNENELDVLVSFSFNIASIN